MEFRSTTERAFEEWGRMMIRYRWWVILVVLAATAALGSQIPKLTVDNSTQGFLHADDPTLLEYNEFRRQFGRDEMVMIALQPPEVFDLEFLRWLQKFHEDLEKEVPYLDEVISLINVRATYGRDEELVVEGLLDDFPRDSAELLALRKRVLANELYVNNVISADGKFTMVMVRPWSFRDQGDADFLAGFDEGDTAGAELEFLKDAENTAVVNAVRELMARHARDDIQMHLAGAPLITERLNDAMQEDIQKFLVLSLLIITSLLAFLFRRASGILLPLSVVVLSLVSTIGIMSILGTPMSIITQILPPFLITVGVCDSIHILAIVYRRVEEGMTREEAIVSAFGHSGLAVLMTSVTTAGGLASFSTAELSHIANLGMLGPIGVALAFIYTVTLLPAVLAVVPLRRRKAEHEHPFLDRVLAGTASVSTRHPWKIVGVTVVVVLISIVGMTRLRFSHDPMNWFPDHEPLKIDMELIDRELRGSLVLEVLADTRRKNGLHDPATLRQLDRLTELAELAEWKGLFVGSSVSVINVTKEIHRGLNENREEFYAIPHDRQLIAQELLLFENSGADDLERLVDTQFQTARITLRTPQDDAILFPQFIAHLDEIFQSVVGPDVKLTYTGLMPVLGRTFEAVIQSMARSYMIAILVITPLMILLLGSIRWGLLNMIPNLTPIVMILGLMGWLNIPLDGSTLMLGSIILGLAVDDTIHFMHKFWAYYDKSGVVKDAVFETLRTTGAALLFTSLVLSLGFFVFMQGYMVNMVNFGLLTGLACIFAFLADVIFAPALMTLIVRDAPKSNR